MSPPVDNLNALDFRIDPMNPKACYSGSRSAAQRGTSVAREATEVIRPKAEAREGQVSRSERVIGQGGEVVLRVQGGEADSMLSVPRSAFDVPADDHS
jgi:hypothetical protein